VDEAVVDSAPALLAQDRLTEVGQQVEEARLVDVLGGPLDRRVKTSVAMPRRLSSSQTSRT